MEYLFRLYQQHMIHPMSVTSLIPKNGMLHRSQKKIICTHFKGDSVDKG